MSAGRCRPRRALTGRRSRASPATSSSARGACAASPWQDEARTSTLTLRAVCVPAGPRAEGCACAGSTRLSNCP
eukprot:3629151-Alexandrium_andersonii.AAC.1